MAKDIFTFEMGEAYELSDIPEPHQSLLAGCYHSGACDADVAEAEPYFSVDDHAALARYLTHFGAWDETELADKQANLRRLLWTMAADISEQGIAYLDE